MPLTVVSFHAHPDDETLLTGGTLAKLARQGHRVVVVTATDGAAGLTSREVHARGALGATRRRELEEAAAALGVQRVVVLGHSDGSFGKVPVPVAAQRVVAILREEDADVLTGYDPAGGYGHPDHVHVHHVAREAARSARTPVLLEATVDRRRLIRAVRLLRLLPTSLPVNPTALARAFCDPSEITHVVDVRRQLGAKLRALAAHRSQAVGARQRTVRLLLNLPAPLLRPVLGHEWFTEVGGQPSARVAAALKQR